jgi:hypothetical protein
MAKNAEMDAKAKDIAALFRSAVADAEVRGVA